MMFRNHTWCSLYYEPLIYMKSQNDKIGLIRTIDKVGPFTFLDYPHIWWCLLDAVYLIWFIWARLTLDNRCSLDHITALDIHCLSWWDYINLKKRRLIFYMAYVIFDISYVVYPDSSTVWEQLVSVPEVKAGCTAWPLYITQTLHKLQLKRFDTE